MKRYTERLANGTCITDGMFYLTLDTYKDAIEKLADYEEAEEEGRLFRSPLAIGDTVWVIVLGGIDPIQETVVTSITKNKFGIILNFGEGMYAYQNSMNIDYYGILFFKTEEDAEIGLKNWKKEKEYG